MMLAIAQENDAGNDKDLTSGKERFQVASRNESWHSL
jgi:hypothetical protein